MTKADPGVTAEAVYILNLSRLELYLRFHGASLRLRVRYFKYSRFI